MIQMLRTSFLDMIPFLVLLYMIILIFCLVDNVVHQHHRDAKRRELPAFYNFGMTYQQLLGENPHGRGMSNLDWFIFFAFTTLLNIVALNLLISLISNTFDKVLMSLDAS